MQPAHFLIAASIARALKTAISYCVSVKMTTPALPPESAIASKAAVLETSVGEVVTLAKMPASGSGPGFVPECQPTTAAPDLAAASNATCCSLVSKPPTTMPSGLSVRA